MSPTPSGAPLPPELGGPAEAYLRAFLDGGEADRAVSELAADVAYWQDEDLVAVLTAARAIVTSRVRVTLDAEAVTLVDDLGVTAGDAADVLGMEPGELDDRLSRAREALGRGAPPAGDDLGVQPTTPAPPVAPHPEPVHIDAESRREDDDGPDAPTPSGPTVGAWLAVALFVLAVLLAMLASGR